MIHRVVASSSAYNARDNDDCHGSEKPSNSPSLTPKHILVPEPVNVGIRSDSMQSTLTFILPTVSLLAIIPATLAWRHGESAPGSTHDSNFWQAVSSSIMQLLSLVIFIWPTSSNPRLSQLTWFWIWLLAGFSATCAIVSVPVYLVYPTIWSFVVAFAGVLAQAVVLLQFVSAV